MFTLLMLFHSTSQVVDIIALAFVGYSLLGALAPGSPTFSDANQKDVRKRPKVTP